MVVEMEKAEDVLKSSTDFELLKTFTDQEKFHERSIEQIKKHREAGASEDEITFMELTVHGGNCIRCFQPFREEQVDNPFSKYVHYVPDCECWEDEKPKEKPIDETAKYIQAKIPKQYINTAFEKWDRDNVDQATNKAFQQAFDFVRARKYETYGLLLYGDIGTGKTMVAVSVLKRLIDSGSRCIYVSMSDLIHNAIGSGDDFAMGLRDYDYVLFDDIDKIGYDRSKKENAWINELLFRVFDGILTAGKKIIATCNYKDISEFQRQYDAPIVSRMIAECEFVQFSGNDYRITRRRIGG